MTPQKRKDRKFIMIMLMLISTGLLLISGVLFFNDQKNRQMYEQKIFNEAGKKKPQEITPKEMAILIKMSKTETYNKFVAFTESENIKWILTQNDSKDYGSLNIVWRLDTERTIFFKTAVRAGTSASSNLEGWVTSYGVEMSHIPVEPVPPSQKFFSFITSGQGIVLIVLILVIGSGVVWSITRGPLSGFGPFSKSNAHWIFNETTTFNDVAGVDEAKQDVVEVLDNFLLHARNKQQGQNELLPPMSKGVLLVGPPGTGKTLIARAAANRTKVPFGHINGASFVEVFVGVGPKQVRRLFRDAKKNAPSIIFIDELDGVGAKRSEGLSTGGDKEYANTVLALLSEMDGFDKNIPVLVMAATNRIGLVDEALLRPGRFTHHIFVDLPDKTGRIEILKIHMRELDKHGLIAEDLSLENLSAQIAGFSGDDIRNLVNQAHTLALRRWNDKQIEVPDRKLEQADFENAIDKVAFGSENKSRIISKAEKERTAIHEVGHLMVCYHLEEESEDRVYKISIVQHGKIGGHVRPLPSDNMFLTKRQLSSRLAFYAGGIVAEDIYFYGNTSNSASHDISKMTRLAYDMVTRWTMASDELGFRSFDPADPHTNYSPETAKLIDQKIGELTSRAKEDAKRIILENKEKFDYMVERILEAETLQGDELRKILEN